MIGGTAAGDPQFSRGVNRGFALPAWLPGLNRSQNSGSEGLATSRLGLETGLAEERAKPVQSQRQGVTSKMAVVVLGESGGGGVVMEAGNWPMTVRSPIAWLIKLLVELAGWVPTIPG